MDNLREHARDLSRDLSRVLSHGEGLSQAVSQLCSEVAPTGTRKALANLAQRVDDHSAQLRSAQQDLRVTLGAGENGLDAALDRTHALLRSLGNLAESEIPWVLDTLPSQETVNSSFTEEETLSRIITAADTLIILVALLTTSRPHGAPKRSTSRSNYDFAAVR